MESETIIRIEPLPFYKEANAVLRLIDGFDRSLYNDTDVTASSIFFHQKEEIYEMEIRLEYGEMERKVIGKTEAEAITFLINNRIYNFSNQEDDEEEALRRCYQSLLNQLPASKYMAIVSPILHKAFVLERKKDKTSFSLHTSRGADSPVVLWASLSNNSEKTTVMIENPSDSIDEFNEAFGNSLLKLQLGIDTTLSFSDNNATIQASIGETEIVWQTMLHDPAKGKRITNEFVTGKTALTDLMDFFNVFILYQGLPVPK